MAVYKVEELQDHDVDVEIDGKWVSARPENYKYESWVTRIKNALMVLSGDGDVVVWEKQ